MIPKQIHYCWFGGNPLPAKAKKCIGSWRKFCPDFEIIAWDEAKFFRTFPEADNGYAAMCLSEGKFAFLSDWARLLIIERFGGVYFDTDVEVIRPLDDLLDTAFFGFENDRYVATGLGFGAEPHQEAVLAMLDAYSIYLDGKHGTRGCPELNTEALEKLGLVRDGKRQNVGGAVIYPADFFNPYDDPTGRLLVTENTHTIHWFAKSWMSGAEVWRSRFTRPFHRLFGTDVFHKKRDL